MEATPLLQPKFPCPPFFYSKHGQTPPVYGVIQATRYEVIRIERHHPARSRELKRIILLLPFIMLAIAFALALVVMLFQAAFFNPKLQLDSGGFRAEGLPTRVYSTMYTGDSQNFALTIRNPAVWRADMSQFLRKMTPSFYLVHLYFFWEQE